MAEKRYYWLKLFDDFFSSKRIKKLRNLAGGDTYTIIYLKMQLKSLKDEGYLYFDGVMDDFAEELALDIDEKPEDVKITIQYLLSVGLLETNTDEEIYRLTYMDRVIGSESASTQRSRNCRLRKKEHEMLQCNADATVVQQVGNVEIDIEKDIEKDIDIYNNPSYIPPTTKKKTTSPDVSQMLEESELNDTVKEIVKDWIAYKKEQFRFSYKPTGFKAFLTEIQNNENVLGTEKVCQAINLSMSKGYKGIIWDLVKDKQGSTSAYMDAIKNRVNVVDSW